MFANTDKHTNHYLMQVAQNARKMRKKDKLVKRGRVSTDGHKWGVNGHRCKRGHRQAGKRASRKGTEGHGEARMCMR